MSLPFPSHCVSKKTAVLTAVFSLSQFIFHGIRIAGAKAEIHIQNFLGNRRQLTAATCFFAIHSDGDLRIIIGNITNEDSVVDDVFALLGGPRLGGDGLSYAFLERLENRKIVLYI